MRKFLIGFVAVVMIGGCSTSLGDRQPPGTDGASATPASHTPLPASPGSGTVETPADPPAPAEAIVRGLVGSGTDRFGWVQAPAGRILATYFVPGQRYLGGQLVAATDEIVVIKMHGSFAVSVPAGAKSTEASLVLVLYDASTGKLLPGSQTVDGDAPDLGVGSDPGITDRALAAQRWDLRLVGTVYVRAA